MRTSGFAVAQKKSQYLIALMPEFDSIAFGLTLCLYFIYHMGLFFLFKRYPEKTVIGITRSARVVWTKLVINKRDSILCVQTLRNWILQSSLLASTSITICVGLLAFFRSSATSSDFSDLKIGFTISFYFFSFLAFSQSIRVFNHVSFCILVAEQGEHGDSLSEQLTFGFVASLLNQACLFSTIGFRFFYLSFPFLFWFVGKYNERLYGSVYLLGSTLFILVLLMTLDLSWS